MADTQYSNLTITKKDFTESHLPKGEYQNCTFINCNFSNSSLANILFFECTFESCNLSLCNLNNTSFRDIVFENCKLLGLHFQHGNSFCFSIKLANCNLTHSSFYKLQLKKTIFNQCQLHEVDFSESDLTSAVFEQCDLLGAIFERTNLEKCDFRTSIHFNISPDRNKLKKAKFSHLTIAGLLNEYGIIIE